MRFYVLALSIAAFAVPVAALGLGSCANQCTLGAAALECTSDCGQYCNDRAANQQILACFNCLETANLADFASLNSDLAQVCGGTVATTTSSPEETQSAPVPQTTMPTMVPSSTTTEPETPTQTEAAPDPTSSASGATDPALPAPTASEGTEVGNSDAAKPTIESTADAPDAESTASATVPDSATDAQSSDAAPIPITTQSTTAQSPATTSSARATSSTSRTAGVVPSLVTGSRSASAPASSSASPSAPNAAGKVAAPAALVAAIAGAAAFL